MKMADFLDAEAAIENSTDGEAHSTLKKERSQGFMIFKKNY